MEERSMIRLKPANFRGEKDVDYRWAVQISEIAKALEEQQSTVGL